MNKLFSLHPLVVDKDLARILGLNEALILQQVNYWIEINKKKKEIFTKEDTGHTILSMNGKRNFLFGVLLLSKGPKSP